MFPQFPFIPSIPQVCLLILLWGLRSWVLHSPDSFRSCGSHVTQCWSMRSEQENKARLWIEKTLNPLFPSCLKHGCYAWSCGIPLGTMRTNIIYCRWQSRKLGGDGALDNLSMSTGFSMLLWASYYLRKISLFTPSHYLLRFLFSDTPVLFS